MEDNEIIQVECELSVGNVSWSIDVWAWRSRKKSFLENKWGAINTHKGIKFSRVVSKMIENVRQIMGINNI